MTVKQLIEQLSKLPQDAECMGLDDIDYDEQELRPIEIVKYGMYTIYSNRDEYENKGIVAILCREVIVPIE